MHAEPGFALTRTQESIFEELLSKYLPKSWGNLFRREYMLRLYSQPREGQEQLLANYYFFVFFSCQMVSFSIFGWPRMSGRRTFGSSRPSLGVQVPATFSFISSGKSQFKKCLGKRLEVPDILLPDIRGRLFLGWTSHGHLGVIRVYVQGQKSMGHAQSRRKRNLTHEWAHDAQTQPQPESSTKFCI